MSGKTKSVLPLSCKTCSNNAYKGHIAQARCQSAGDNPHYLSESFMQDRWFLGAPADIAAKIAAWLLRLSLDHLIFQARQPGLPLRQAVNNLEAIAKGVVPVVRAKAELN